MKILFVSSDKFPPFRVDVTELFGKEMVSKGHQIDWLLHSENKCDEAYETQWSGCKAYVGPTDIGESLFSRVRKHWLSVRHDYQMSRLCEQGGHNFVLVKDKFIAALFAMRLAKKKGTKFIYWLSYPFPESSLYEAKTGTARYPLLYRIRGLFFDYVLYKLVAKQATHIFVQSEQMKKDMMERGVPSELMTSVPMGFSQENFEAFASNTSSPIEEEDLDLLYLGTLLGARKMDFCVRVLKKVHETRPETELIFVGDGETDQDRNQILDAAKEAGIEKYVSITGFMPQEEALEYVRRAKVCLSPFYPTPILNSTSPTKLIEYMALAKPVIANDHPEQSLVIEASNCGRCVGYDEAEFAQAAVELLSDPALRASMGEAGRDYVASHRTYAQLVIGVEKKLQALL